MASMNGKRRAAVATLATSLMVMGGAAFASPATASAGNGGKTTSLAPVSKAIETARNTESDVHNQISELQNTPVSKVIETARNTESDVHNLISELQKTR